MVSDQKRVESAAETTTAPLSEGERALWFLQLLNPESAAYNIPRGATIRGALDSAAFRSAWQRLMDRHPVLRSTLSWSDGEPVRLIREAMPVDFEELDASEWAEPDVSEYLLRESSRPFDLERTPPMRIRVLKRSPEEHILLPVWHHTAADLWSIGVMMYELDAIYPAEVEGEPAALRSPKVQYADFVREQAELLDGPEGQRLWEFWRRQLEGAPQVLDLPTDRPRPAVQPWQGDTVAQRFPADLAANLRAVAAEKETTLHALSAAVFAVLLHRYTSQQDFLIGSPRAGRSRRYFQTVGYFVNPILIRIDASGDPSFS